MAAALIVLVKSSGGECDDCVGGSSPYVPDRSGIREQNKEQEGDSERDSLELLHIPGSSVCTVMPPGGYCAGV